MHIVMVGAGVAGCKNVLYLGDAAHGMVPALGQGATQVIEDAAAAAEIIAREWTAGRRNPRHWLRLIGLQRSERMRFAMRFSLDTPLAGGDPVAGTLQKTKPDFLAKLRRLYCDVAETTSLPGGHELPARRSSA